MMVLSMFRHHVWMLVGLLFVLAVSPFNVNAEQASSTEEAAQIAQSQYPEGKILSVTPQNSTYQVKILFPSGQVRRISISARTGAQQD